jgi:hypothetical protein
LIRDGGDGRRRLYAALGGTASTWGWTKFGTLCGDQAVRARMSGRLSLFLHKAGRGR